MRKTVSLDALDHFEEDENGQLFWKGNKIAVETHVHLPRYVNIFAIIAGFSTFAQAVMAILAYFR